MFEQTIPAHQPARFEIEKGVWTSREPTPEETEEAVELAQRAIYSPVRAATNKRKAKTAQEFNVVSISQERYIVFDFDDSKDGTPSVYDVMGSNALLSIIDDAHRTHAKIAVFRLGECLLDWS